MNWSATPSNGGAHRGPSRLYICKAFSDSVLNRNELLWFHGDIMGNHYRLRDIRSPSSFALITQRSALATGAIDT